MAQDKHSMRWRVAGQSVRGATHERVGRPNQDAIGWLPQSGNQLPLILALADGHGSRRSFRSERGARLAVETAAEVLGDFLAGRTESLSATKRAAEEWLPRALVRRWLQAVDDDLAAHPLDADELELLRAPTTRTSGQTGTAGLPVAYGTTLLATAVTAGFILYLQLGDGEILTVSRAGEVSRPLPKDERLFANETTSLCSTDAWRDFRVYFQVVSNAPPALILLSTDGYPNSFRDEQGFLKVGPDILEMIRTAGLDAVNEQLASWLTESTYAGSGDDVTLGLICSEDAVGPTIAPQKSRSSDEGANGRQLNQHEDMDAPVEYEV
jgi:serine/threonine protein phosphatase PrpC